MLSLNPSWKAFDYGTTHFWAHYGLCTFGFLLAVITYITQAAKPAPYGKHQTTNHSFAHWFIKDLHTLYQMLSQGSFCFHLYFFTMELRKKPPTCYFTVCGSLITYIVELSTPGSCDTVVQRPLWVYP